MGSLSRRRCLVEMAAALNGLLIAACDLGSGPLSQVPATGAGTVPPVPARPAASPPAPSQAPVTVQVRGLPSSVGFSTNKWTVAFTNQHPEVSLEWLLWQDANGIKQTAAAEGLSDVVSLWSGAAAEPAFQGRLLGLNRFIKRDRYDLSDYWPGCLEASTWRADLYTLHTEVDTNLIFCNRALFAGTGLAPPSRDWTWAELLETARELRRGQGAKSVYGFAPYLWMDHPSSHDTTIPWIWANGGEVLDRDITKPLIDQPKAQEALQWLADLRHSHKVWPATKEIRAAGASELELLFAKGQLAMLYVLRGWMRQGLLGHSSSPQFDMAEPPQGPAARANWLHVQASYFIGAATQVPDQAWQFLTWWAGGDVQREVHRDQALLGTRMTIPGTMPPARRSLATEMRDWFGPAVVEGLEYARIIPPHPQWGELVAAYDEGVWPLWQGKATVEEVTVEVARKQRSILG